MASSIPPIEPARIHQARADIQKYITDPEDLEKATKQMDSVADFAPGDERCCTWHAALDNCEQIKGYLPHDAPEAVFENIDRIADEVRRIEKAQIPFIWRLVSHPLTVTLAGLALGWYLFAEFFQR